MPMLKVLTDFDFKRLENQKFATYVQGPEMKERILEIRG
jgi:hypothetical protein